MRKFIRRTMWGLGTFLAVVAILLFLAYRASQQIPAFYDRVLTIAPENEAAGEDLERNVLELRNNVHKAGVWETVFTEQEINSWLARDLPRKFADALPEGLHDPRVAVEDGQLHVACRYKRKKLQSVVSLALDVSVSERPNVLMVRVDRARAGWLPIPFTRLMADVSKVARKAEIGLRWADEDGDPIAIVTIPEIYDAGRRLRVEIESIALRDHKLFCYGRTVDEGKAERPAEKSVSD